MLSRQESLFKTNCQELKNALGAGDDVIFRLVTGPKESMFFLAMIDGLTDTKQVESLLLKQGQLYHLLQCGKVTSPLMENLLPPGEVKQTETLQEAIEGVLAGQVALLYSQENKPYLISMRSFPDRSITESEKETVVRGPRDAFVENLRKNTALVRRRIKSTSLCIESVTIGEISRTKVSLLYLKGSAKKEDVQNLKKRLENCPLRFLSGSGQLEQLLEDHPLSIYPQIENSERPDRIAQGLSDGHIALLVDGSPSALLMPVVFANFFVSPEDSYQHFAISSLYKIIRYLAMLLSLYLPSIYIALSAYHPGMLSTDLILLSAYNRTQVPLSPITETFLILGILELLRKASVRMPRPISQTLGIVGGIVIGDAAISAGLISPLPVVIIGISKVASFCLPSISLSGALRMNQLLILLLTSFFGLVGLSIGMLVTVLLQSRLSSFGKAYMAPLAPLKPKDLLTSFIQLPAFLLKGESSSYIPLEYEEDNA